MRRGRGVDVSGVTGYRDARILGAPNLDGGMLCQLGDHRVGIRVRPAVQLLHNLRDAQVGSFHLAWIVHRHYPIIVLTRPSGYAQLTKGEPAITMPATAPADNAP